MDRFMSPAQRWLQEGCLDGWTSNEKTTDLQREHPNYHSVSFPPSWMSLICIFSSSCVHSMVIVIFFLLNPSPRPLKWFLVGGKSKYKQVSIFSIKTAASPQLSLELVQNKKVCISQPQHPTLIFIYYWVYPCLSLWQTAHIWGTEWAKPFCMIYKVSKRRTKLHAQIKSLSLRFQSKPEETLPAVCFTWAASPCVQSRGLHVWRLQRWLYWLSCKAKCFQISISTGTFSGVSPQTAAGNPCK